MAPSLEAAPATTAAMRSGMSRRAGGCWCPGAGSYAGDPARARAAAGGADRDGRNPRQDVRRATPRTGPMSGDYRLRGRAVPLTDRQTERGVLDRLASAVRAGGSRVLVVRG